VNGIRRLALLGLLAVVTALAYRAVTAERGAFSSPEPPPGFQLPVEDFGQVGFAVRGPVRLTLYREGDAAGGARLAVPRMRIDGHDPEPVAGADGAPEAMRLTDLRLTALDEDGRAPRYRVEAPTASLPLVDGAERPTPDPDRDWELRSPRVLLPTPHGQLVLDIEAATLAPEEGVVRGRGPYSLRSGDMVFTGEDLSLDLGSGRIDFAPEKPLSWSFPAAGGVLRGTTDGGGSLVEEEGGVRRLVLGARERCTMLLPQESGLSGEFRCGGLDFRLAPSSGAQGWAVRRAVAEAPSSWVGVLHDGRDCSTFGQEAVFLWDETALEGIHQSGPLAAFLGDHPDGSRGGWLTADGGAHLDASERSFLLYGGVGGWFARGWFHADSYSGDDRGWTARGDVSLADGIVLSDRFEVAPNGSMLAEGSAVFRPDPQLAIAAPRLLLTAPDPLKPDFRHFHAEGGVITHLALQDRPAVLRSRLLDASGQLEVPDFRAAEAAAPDPEEAAARIRDARLDARHEIVIEQEGARFTGTHFAAHGTEDLELRGEPARAELFRTGEDGEPAGSATAEATRLVLQGTEILPVGDPVLRFPAGELGLAGDEIELRSSRMRFQQDGSRGALTGEVRARGGLELDAWSVVWAPGEDGAPVFVLEPETGQRVRVRGELLPEPGAAPGTAGQRFDFAAREVRVLPEQQLGLLDREAEMRVELAPDRAGDGPGVLVVRGRHAEVTPDGGLFRENSTLELDRPSGRVEAGADRIHWERGDEVTTITLEGNRPWLRAGGLEAAAERLRLVQPRDGARGAELELIGGAGRPARLQLANGQVLVGERLRYNFRTRLYDMSSGSLGNADDRP
jgi:hypothetical protein